MTTHIKSRRWTKEKVEAHRRKLQKEWKNLPAGSSKFASFRKCQTSSAQVRYMIHKPELLKERVARVVAMHEKEFSLKSPSGVIYKGKNIAQFIRDYSCLFTEFELGVTSSAIRKCKIPGATPANRASFGLVSLIPGRKHQRLSWHGWTWAHT